MIPVDKKWYRYLLVTAIFLGIAGAASALVYNSVTNFGVDFFFGDAGTGWWSGKWWWIPFTAVGGLLVAIIRDGWKIQKNVPGGIETIGNGWINPKNAIELVAIAVISAIFGASLGPSFGLILLGGAAGSWLVTKLKLAKSKEAKDEYALTGMAGALGGAFSAPIFGAIIVSEVSPSIKKNYVSAFLPQIIAATAGFTLYFGITGETLFGTFGLPQFEYEPIHLLTAVFLGLAATVVLMLFVFITQAVNKVASMMKDSRVRGFVGGAFVGLITFALPLTAGSGVSQLNEVIATPTNWGIAFLIVVLIAKILGVSISLASGFLGGNVFPIMFIGGVTGVILHIIFPDLPLSLAIASMLAAVPGAYLKAPLSLTLIGAGTVGLTAVGAVPVAIALVVAHGTMSFIRWQISQRVTDTT